MHTLDVVFKSMLLAVSRQGFTLLLSWIIHMDRDGQGQEDAVLFLSLGVVVVITMLAIAPPPALYCYVCVVFLSLLGLIIALGYASVGGVMILAMLFYGSVQALFARLDVDAPTARSEWENVGQSFWSFALILLPCVWED